MPGILESCSPPQLAKFLELEQLLIEENTRKNLVSKKSLLEFKERHLLHSLALSHKTFPDASTVVDWGTGGGLPLLPLAIRFPDVTFVGVDSVGRKTEAVNRMAEVLGLTNVSVLHSRAEEAGLHVHYSVSRATAQLHELWAWHKRVAVPLKNAQSAITELTWHPGLICLKGGDLQAEVSELEKKYNDVHVSVTPLTDIDSELYGIPPFEGKVVVEVQE